MKTSIGRGGRRLALAGVFLIFCLSIVASPSSGEETFQKASDFTLKSLSGKNIKLSEQRGRVVIVNFWSIGCAPCKKELPYFNRLYGKYKDLGLAVLGVNIDKSKGDVLRMSRALEITFPVLPDPSGEVSGLYKIRSLSTTYVIAKDGTIRNIHRGFGPQDEVRYEQEIRSLLKE